MSPTCGLNVVCFFPAPGHPKEARMVASRTGLRVRPLNIRTIFKTQTTLREHPAAVAPYQLACELQSEILQALLTDRSRVGSNGVSGQDVGIGHYYVK